MNGKKIIGSALTLWIAGSFLIAHKSEKKTKEQSYSAELMESIDQREKKFYEKYTKRWLDVLCASTAITVFSPLYVALYFLIRFKLGAPVIFTQDRPGQIQENGKELIFKIYKFRSMTDEKNKKGELLSDEERLTPFGKKLRATSLDELPEAFNILNGTMSVIGPRPQLIRDLVFMSEEQRKRHTAKPGLSGLAQVKGRNAIKWDKKISLDLEYINNISLSQDILIILETVRNVFLKKESSEELDVTCDYGDELLNDSRISREKYDFNQLLAKKMQRQ